MEAGIQIYLDKIKALRLSESQQKYDKKQDREISLEIHDWKTRMKYLRNFSHGPYWKFGAGLRNPSLFFK